MNIFNKKGPRPEFKSKYKRAWKIFFVILGILLLLGIAIFWKAGNVFNKVSTDGGLFQNLIGALPGVNDELQGEDEDRINVLILGIRGKNLAGGGLLTDTIIVASIKPKDRKISMISIPRDFYVDNPALGTKSKINAVYVYGERKSEGQGLEDMKKVVSEITGLDIPYGGVVNFKGFSDLVDAIGGVDITLEKSFSEPIQFNEAHVCDNHVFTVPTGKYKEEKVVTSVKRGVKNYSKTVQLPLCTNPDVECGGNFVLPAGNQTLDGEKALCYVRSRTTSTDFDRAKRQQEIIELIKEKLLSAGTLTDFGKLSAIVDSLGNNTQTNMQLWEMKRMFELYNKMQNPEIFQKVLDNRSAEGLLYSPSADLYPGAGSILLPVGDNYDKIREMANSIFPTSSEDVTQL